MGRNKKTDATNTAQPIVDVEVNEGLTNQPETVADNEMRTVDASTTKAEQSHDISPREAELMRLYPQYEEIWITPEGFVHPKGVPTYLIKGAKLYQNKYFNKH